MQAIARFEGVVADVLNKLVSLGYFQTRSEAIRASVLAFGKEYGLLRVPRETGEAAAVKAMKLHREIMSGKRKTVPLKQALIRAGIE
ncbi:TPA: hypothetical protein HA318_04910 [Candidatus Micrarchaeota archaeon]|nr:MAG: hypothetical protein AUJ65_00410 [Candidatus Micrarchaeota archaeon CG1_02_51_15]HII39312.1 hypothetical protein [Candidatus Micrarchaeota archaeon]